MVAVEIFFDGNDKVMPGNGVFPFETYHRSSRPMNDDITYIIYVILYELSWRWVGILAQRR